MPALLPDFLVRWTASLGAWGRGLEQLRREVEPKAAMPKQEPKQVQSCHLEPGAVFTGESRHTHPKGVCVCNPNIPAEQAGLTGKCTTPRLSKFGGQGVETDWDIFVASVQF